jgi:hypothetical protein
VGAGGGLAVAHGLADRGRLRATAPPPELTAGGDQPGPDLSVQWSAVVDPADRTDCCWRPSTRPDARVVLTTPYFIPERGLAHRIALGGDAWSARDPDRAGKDRLHDGAPCQQRLFQRRSAVRGHRPCCAFATGLLHTKSMVVDERDHHFWHGQPRPAQLRAQLRGLADRLSTRLFQRRCAPCSAHYANPDPTADRPTRNGWPGPGGAGRWKMRCRS